MSIDRPRDKKQETEGEIPKIESDNPNNRPVDLSKEKGPQFDQQKLLDAMKEEYQKRLNERDQG
jgi:hypothetical protein